MDNITFLPQHKIIHYFVQHNETQVHYRYLNKLGNKQHEQAETVEGVDHPKSTSHCCLEHHDKLLNNYNSGKEILNNI
jgi:hypothetical protein